MRVLEEGRAWQSVGGFGEMSLRVGRNQAGVAEITSDALQQTSAKQEWLLSRCHTIAPHWQGRREPGGNEAKKKSHVSVIMVGLHSTENTGQRASVLDCGDATQWSRRFGFDAEGSRGTARSCAVAKTKR